MRGQLVTIYKHTSLKNEISIRVMILADGISLDQALLLVQDCERNDIDKAISNTEQDESALEELSSLRSMRKEVTEIKWPDKVNVDGHYIHESLVFGSVTDSGYEYRFVPMPFTIEGIDSDPYDWANKDAGAMRSS